jgi:hypothetical protein
MRAQFHSCQQLATSQTPLKPFHLNLTSNQPLLWHVLLNMLAIRLISAIKNWPEAKGGGS